MTSFLKELNQYLTPLVNTMVLIILFFYQKNKNKLLIYHNNKLTEEIGQQGERINEMSTIIAGQKKVLP